MHNHNFLRPSWKIWIYNLPRCLAARTEFTNKQEDKQGFVGYPNTHTHTLRVSCLGIAIKSFSSGFQHLLRCRHRNHNQREEVKCGVCEKHCILCGGSLKSQHADWARSSFSLKAFALSLSHSNIRFYLFYFSPDSIHCIGLKFLLNLKIYR